MSDILEDPAAVEPPPPTGGEIDAVDAGTFGGVESQATALGIRQQTQFGDVRKRFLRNKLAVVGLVMIAIVVLSAVFAPLLAPADPYKQDLLHTIEGPSRAHLLGTDEVGRDQLSRLIYGARIAVVVGLAAMLLATTIGIVLGAVSGYLGRGWDAVIMRTADVFFAFPLLVGAIVIVLVLGRGVTSVVLSLAIFTWATTARLLRSSILSIREAEYVEAARSLGASGWRIVTRHVLPNSLAPVMVFAAVSVGSAVVAETTLSFLGVGVKLDAPDWGNMVAAGQKYFAYKDYLWFFPSMAVVFTVLGFMFVADGMRDALDPKLRGR
jgi:peptide/nickel transport system permease protein